VALQIIWTPDAILHFNEILEYWIEKNGSQDYSKKLFQTVKSSLLLLTKYPESGKLTEKQGIRAKIVKDYYIFYLLK
jgi:plasmid stabilization system protein ParE